MEPAAYLGLGIATVGAVFLWLRGQKAYAPAVVFFAAWAIADFTSRAIRTLVLVPWRAAHHPLPYLGFVRLAFHAHQACYLFASAGVCAYALWVYRRVDLRYTLGAYCATLGALIASYPEQRAELPEHYLFLHLVYLAPAFVASALHPGRSNGPRRVAAWAALAQVFVIVGPLMADNPAAAWPLAQAVYTLLFLAVSVQLWGLLWTTFRRPSTP